MLMHCIFWHISLSRFNIGSGLESGLTAPVRACVLWGTAQHDCPVSPNNSRSPFHFLVWQWRIKLLPYQRATQLDELSSQASLYPVEHTSHASRDFTLVTTPVAQNRGAQIFQILETTSKFYTPELRHETNFEDPQILGAAMGNTINLALCRPGFMHPWLRRHNKKMSRGWWTGRKALRSGHGLIWSKTWAVNWNEFKIHRCVHR